jgi:hypothetical protein
MRPAVVVLSERQRGWALPACLARSWSARWPQRFGFSVGSLNRHAKLLLECVGVDALVVAPC